MAAASRRIARLKQIDRAAVARHHARRNRRRRQRDRHSRLHRGGGAAAVPIGRGRADRIVPGLGGASAAGPRTAIGADELGRFLYDVTPTGAIAFFSARQGRSHPSSVAPPALAAATVTAVVAVAARATSSQPARAMAASRFCRCSFRPVYEGGVLKDVTVDVADRGVVTLDTGGTARFSASPTSRKATRSSSPASCPTTEIRLLVEGRRGRNGRPRCRPRAGPDRGHRAWGGPARSSPAPTRARCITGSWATPARLTDVSPSGRRRSPRCVTCIGNRTFIAGTADGRVSAWFRAPVGADGNAGDGARRRVRAAGRAGHRRSPRRRGIAPSRRAAPTDGSCCAIRRPAARSPRLPGSSARHSAGA